MNTRLAALLLPPVALLLAAPAARADGGGQFLPASDHRFRYEGRFDVSDPAAPVVIWEGSTIRIDFSGDRAVLEFGPVTGQVFLDAAVDGRTEIVGLKAGPGAEHALAAAGPGTHHLVLFKRTEAAAGTAAFRGIGIAAGAGASRPSARHYKMRMQFIGDSITAGACDEDGAADQWEDRSTHDAAFSWAALTSAAFDADGRNISVSGIGLASGWDDVLEGQVWDRVYPRADSPRADLTGWKPDVVFILLGENDDSYPRAHHLPFPAGFTANYEALVHAVRQAYPRAEIVLLTGAMWGGHNGPELAAAWGKAVADLEAADPRVAHFRFSHWSQNHPRVADHRALADELAAWLRSQAFMGEM